MILPGDNKISEIVLAQEYRIEGQSVSIIIPTFNGASRICNCLEALIKQCHARNAELFVVDDGSTDNTAEIVRRYSAVRLITQSNAGPAAARNRGAVQASGAILIFTDDDCVPANGWLEAMLEPFTYPEVVGAKGVYRTCQNSLVARFVQIEYEDRYRRMARFPEIDFVDTYSAAFRREPFLEMNGYDPSFPIACAEDVDLSYRMAMQGWKMRFVPEAVVYHTHPDSIGKYLRKKYKFAFWRIQAVRKNPSKGIKDSHTPQLMKLQLLFPPVLLLASVIDIVARPSISVSAIATAAFLLSTVPFVSRAIVKDPPVGLLAPVFLALRACAQFLGVLGGTVWASRNPSEVPANLPREKQSRS